MLVPRLRSLAWLTAAALTIGSYTSSTAQAADPDEAPLVAVTAIARDAAIDALYSGLTDALRDAGYHDGENLRLRFDSAEADAERASALVRDFARARASVIVALTEPSARSAISEPLRVPLVIAGIDADTAARLHRERRARLLTGVVEDARFDTQLALIREITPSIEAVAIPVDAEQPPDRETLRAITAFAHSIGLDVETLPVSLTREAVAATVNGYAPEQTALFLDRRLFPRAPIERLIALGESANLQVFASDEEAVVHGALAAVVPEPYGTGRQIGRLVAQILKQPSAARTPLQAVEPSYVIINQDTATRLGLQLPNTVLARRGRIIDWADVGGPRPRDKPVIPEPPPADDVGP